MYAKLYASVLNSSLWAEDAWTCKLFITMLVMADREGYIYGSPVGLARQACMTQEQTDKALARLMAPDPNSSDLMRNPENEGRRVEVTESGWRVINYPYYRGFRDSDERRVQNREAKRRSRARSAAVSNGQQGHPSHPSDSDHTQIRNKNTKRAFVPPTIAEVDAEIAKKYPEYADRISGSDFVAKYESNGWVVGKNLAPMKSWKGALYTWVSNAQRAEK